MNTPILFIVFSRYDTAIQVFSKIREARPPRLYIAADAPRKDKPQEAKECERVRDIAKMVDWPCKVKTLFQTENQGCGIGPFKAISWFFENEDEGIVLEDDCLPHPDFFRFCEEMLCKYRNDNRIGLITGRCNFDVVPQNDSSYFLSAFHFCWGWASWKRVWKNYDYNLTTVNAADYRRSLVNYFGFWNPLPMMWRMNIYYECKRNPPRDIWDYQFCISTQLRGQYTIVPKVNLVRNIGFDSRATHTAGLDDNKSAESIYPISHPKELKHNRSIDLAYAKKRYRPLSAMYNYVKNLLKH